METANLKEGSCFWGHKWTKWEQYEQPIHVHWTEKVGIDRRQKRFCVKCGKVQDKLID